MESEPEEQKKKSVLLTVVGFVIVGLIVVFLVAEAELVQTAQESTTALLLATLSCSFSNLAYLTSLVSFLSSKRRSQQQWSRAREDSQRESASEVFAWNTDNEEDPFGEVSPLEAPNPSFVQYLSQEVTKDGLTKRALALRSVGLGLLFWAVLLIYFYSLGKTEAASAVTIYNTCTAFVYAFSLCLLKEKLELLKILAVILSIVGVILVSFGDIGSSTSGEAATGDTASEDGGGLTEQTIDAIVGDVAAFVAAIGTGLYFVLFKMLLGDSGNVTISLYTGMTGTTILLLMGPVTVTQLLVLQWEIPGAEMAVVILLATCAGFVINYLMNVGISLTSPLFISIGCMLSVPGTAVADLILRDIAIGPLQILGIVVVIAGFVLLNIDVPAVKAKLLQLQQRWSSYRKGTEAIQSPDRRSDNEFL